MPVQRGMLYHYLKDSNENIYNIQLSFSLRGNFEIEILVRAFEIVQRNNETLRSVFRWEGMNNPIQVILKKTPVEIYMHDLCDMPANHRDEEMERLTSLDRLNRFDLNSLPMRVRCIKIAHDHYRLNISYHHILWDGWSTSIFLNELFEAYNLHQFSVPQGFNKPSLMSFIKSIRWKETAEVTNFWRKYLHGYEIRRLSDQLSGGTEIRQVKKYVFACDNNKIDDFSRKYQVTKASVIYAAYALLLQRYCHTNDIVFGSTVSNRVADAAGSNKVIGNFINTVPLRVKTGRALSCLAFVQDVNADLIHRSDFHTSSLLDIYQAVSLVTDDVLFDSVVGIENYPVDPGLKNKVVGFDIELDSVYENTSVPLVFLAFFKEECPAFEINYKEHIYPEDYIVGFAHNFLYTLDNLLDHPQQDVSKTEIVLPPYRALVSSDFNNASEKMDRKVLSPPGAAQLEVMCKPENELESKLVEIWASVLGLDTKVISTTKSFIDLGGHSLRIILMVNRIYKSMNVLIPVNEVFNYRTIRELAVYIKILSGAHYVPVPRAAVQPGYQLSAAQRRIYFLYTFDRTSLAYNGLTAFYLGSDADTGRLETVFKQLIDRYEIYRTTFDLIDETPCQIIHSAAVFQIEHFYATEDEIEEVTRQFVRPFDLSVAPLIRVGLVHLFTGQYILLIDVHHIVSDGVSGQILAKEFATLYRDEELSDPDLHYKDYAEWQQSPAEQQKIAGQKAFWIKQFSEEVKKIDLPYDYNRPAIKDFVGDSVTFRIDAVQTNRLKEVAGQQGATLFMLLFAAYNVLLARLSGEEDVVIGVPVSSRNHPDLETMPGMFVNTLPLRNYPTGSKSFRDFLKDVKERTVSSFDNKEYPYEGLLEHLQLPRDMSRNPLFETLFSFQNADDGTDAMPNLRPYPLRSQVAKFDLSLLIYNDCDSLTLEFEYSTHLFKPETIDRWAQYYRNILSVVAANDGQVIGDIAMVGPEEKERLVNDFAGTVTGQRGAETIASRFEKAVATQGGRAAIFFEGSSITYQQLYGQVNGLAAQVAAQQPGTSMPVIVLLPRSFELIVSLFAVLKAGHAYVPVDPAYPPERIRHLVENSGAGVIVTHSSCETLIGKLPATYHTIYADVLPAHGGEDVVLAAPSPEGLAYSIYTSGSTGNPKGVLIEHHSVVNFIDGIKNRIHFVPGSKVLALTTVSFDIFGLEVIFPLLEGHTVVLANEARQKDVFGLLALIRQERVDAVQITPSHLKLLLQCPTFASSFGHVSILMVGGEAFPPDMLQELRQNFKGKIYNMYGPTETTIWSTVQDLTEAVAPDIGRPIDNTIIRILNNRGQLQPIGVPGELCIGGEGVARGYKGNDARTNEKFITDPIGRVDRLYRTGDLAKWLPNGNIACLGRIDSQIKIHGFRIEPGEIESRMLLYPEIIAAAADVKEERGDKVLVGYYVSAAPLPEDKLRQHLVFSLPAYMVPVYFVWLPALPLTPNGKLNRNLLPDPVPATTSPAYVDAVTHEERLLAAVWAQVLELERVGVTDNFFSIGGDSIRSIRVASKMRSQGYDVTVQDIFTTQTIRQLAGLLKPVDDVPAKVLTSAHTSFHDDKVTQAQRQKIQQQYEGGEDIYPLSPMQEGMLFYSLKKSTAANYFNVVSLQATGVLNRQAVEDSLNDFVKRHQILRTVFVYEGMERPLQVVLKQKTLSIDSCDVREACLQKGKHVVVAEIQETEKRREIDIRRDPLVRFVILQIADQEHVFIWGFHHILIDGWSMGILMQEFEQLYTARTSSRALSLPPVHPYGTYIQWLEHRDKTHARAYWHKYLSSYDSLTSFPKKHPVKDDHYHLKSNVVEISAVLSERIRKLARQYSVTLNTIIRTAWSLLLSKYANTSDVVFGSVVSGRPAEVAGVEGMVGLFINTVPVRVQFSKDDTVLEAFRKIQTNELHSAGYHYHPLTDILEQSVLNQNLFDHIVTFENVQADWPEYEGDLVWRLGDGALEVRRLDSFIQTNYDLSVTVVPQKSIQIRYDYNCHVYDADVIGRLGQHFINLVAGIEKNVDRKISQISIYTDEEAEAVNRLYSQDLEKDFRLTPVQELCMRSFRKYRTHIAIEEEGSKITYHELDERVNQVFNEIQCRQIPQHTFIGVMCEDRTWFIASILGILKAGCAFVPLDIRLPVSRLSAMTGQYAGQHIITDQWKESGLEEALAKDTIWIRLKDIVSQDTTPGSDTPRYSLSDRIYIYFTSGSTGTPKGIIGRNKGLAHFITWETEAFQVDHTFRFSQFTTPSFDAILRDIFVPLCSGATLCVPEKDLLDYGKDICPWLDRQQITMVHCVPSFFKLMQKQGLADHAFPSLKYVMLAGERIAPEDLQYWYSQVGDGVTLVNFYGATETTLIKAYHIIRRDETQYLPVIAMPGAQLLVLDEYMSLCPPGALGEIYIRTPYRTEGYLEGSTYNEKYFVPNPFSGDANDLLYKTGDIAKRSTDSLVEIMGRKDRQIKVNGIRIEPDDIRIHIMALEGVSDAVVLDHTDAGGDKYLVAYVVGENMDERQLKIQLSNVLPAYMVPAFIIILGQMPLTLNGKVDRKALPVPVHVADHAASKPANAVEEKLAEIWSQVLKIEPAQVNVTESFFETGAHSLKLLLFINRVNKYYNVNIPIQEVLAKKTIQRISDYLITVKHIELESSGQTLEIPL